MDSASTIVPAIVPRSAEHLIETLALVSFAGDVQIDLVDGVFAHPATWPYDPLGSLSDIKIAIEPFEIEVDLMVESNIEAAYQWLDLGATRLVFHLETVSDMKEIQALKTERGCSVGAAIGNDTLTSVLLQHIDTFDFVQVMGIRHVGTQGQMFDSRAVIRVRELRDLYPNLLISIDGSVNAETIPRLVEAGANRFVVGSAILEAEDPQGAFDTLIALAKSR